MSKTFGVMKTNIGNAVGDTSSPLASLIGVWINNRYRDVAMRNEWEELYYNDTINASAGTSAYALSANFEKAIFVIDVTNSNYLSEVSEQQFWQENYDDFDCSGTPEQYFISRDSSIALNLHPIPNTENTYRVRGKKGITELSATSDTPVIPLEDTIELGAIADTFRYKKQFAKAQQFEFLYAKSLDDKIFQRLNQPNQIIQMTPTVLNREDGIL